MLGVIVATAIGIVTITLAVGLVNVPATAQQPASQPASKPASKPASGPASQPATQVATFDLQSVAYGKVGMLPEGTFVKGFTKTKPVSVMLESPEGINFIMENVDVSKFKEGKAVTDLGPYVINGQITVNELNGAYSIDPETGSVVPVRWVIDHVK